MDSRTLIAIAFVAGLAAGWLGKTWLGPEASGFAIVAADQNEAANSDAASSVAGQAENIVLDTQNDEGYDGNSDENLAIREVVQNSVPAERTQSEEGATGSSIINTFNRLLRDRFYFDAMVLYQDQIQQKKSSARLKKSLLSELNLLLETQSNSDFSELIDNYLSIYYDDIDILLLLADFNKSNGSHLEAIDVYLLAKTYAYTDGDQRKVSSHLNDFVENMYGLYTRQQNWWPLINLFAHIETSGLMNSTFQYRQAIAHLRSGDEVFAVEKLNQLLNDRVVGESAAIALSTLSDGAEVLAASDVFNESIAEESDSIPLEKRGNQYLVKLTDNKASSVRLLIDTGASMTVISIAAFNSFNASGDAIEQERRVFQTAGGVVMGTVYLMPELRLGEYVLQNTQVAVIDFDSDREIDGLLGMNILGQFRFQIDQEEARLLLSRN